MSNPARRPTHRSPTARRGIPPPSHDPAYLSPAAAYSRPQDSIYYRERSDHIDLDLHFSSDLEDEDGDLEERGEEGGGAEDDEEGEAEGDGEGDEEVEEGEEEDSLSDTSSAEYDPDADPEGFAKRLDELAGLREVGVVEERAVRGGPALGLLSGEKAQRGSGADRAASPAPLPFDQFRRYITHHLDSTDWQYPIDPFNLPVRHESQDHMTGKGAPHPIRVLGRQGAGIDIVHPAPRGDVVSDDGDSESEDEVQDLGRLRQEVLGGLGLKGY